MRELLLVGWTWYPSVLIGFGVWTALYQFAVRKHDGSTPLSQQVAFHVGTLVGLIALVSPLDKLGDEYLFSAHMIQHLLLMFVTAPFWLIGTPGWMVEGLMTKVPIGNIRKLVNPLPAFALFTGILWLWHVPALYGLAQESEGIHIFEHLTFIGAALIGWWPVAGADALSLPKPAPPLRMLYLFLLAIPCTALAAVLTFARASFYPFYVTAPHPFGLGALQDQHLGGLLMWLPTHLTLLLALVITFLKWFENSNDHTKQELIEILPQESR